MASIPSIDLHPDKVGGRDSDHAVRKCRLFIEKTRRSGIREMRVITGVGIRGDGTPRLRSRIEKDVLPAYAMDLEETIHEQGGAVLLLRFKAVEWRPTAPERRHNRRFVETQDLELKSERWELSISRIQQAREYLEINEIRRARIKVNQVIKEHFSDLEEVGKDPELLAKAILELENRLEEKTNS